MIGGGGTGPIRYRVTIGHHTIPYHTIGHSYGPSTKANRSTRVSVRCAGCVSDNDNLSADFRLGINIKSGMKGFVSVRPCVSDTRCVPVRQ